MSILIFGSAGMLGQSLLNTFPNATGLDRDTVDVTDPAQVEHAVDDVQPTVIINAVAYNDVDACETPDGLAAAMKLNCDAPQSMAAICARNAITFVHFSTNYVFAGDTRAGYPEDAQPAPVNAYGESKWAGEQAVRRAMSDVRHYLIRTSKLFGEPGTSPLAKKSFFETMRTLSTIKDELQVIDDELGNFTYTPDLARYTQALLTENYPAGTYHGVNEHPVTWYAGARTLFDISGWGGRLTPVTANTLPRSAKRPHYSALLNTKGPKMRGYEEALREFLNKS
jgi:dTDP-4-dehydrorhamnose reductase